MYIGIQRWITLKSFGKAAFLASEIPREGICQNFRNSWSKMVKKKKIRDGQNCQRKYSLVTELLELIHGFTTAEFSPLTFDLQSNNHAGEGP